MSTLGFSRTCSCQGPSKQAILLQKDQSELDRLRQTELTTLKQGEEIAAQKKNKDIAQVENDEEIRARKVAYERSALEADAILRHVPYVVGMNDAITDRAAIAYSIGFYQGIFNGEEISVAHRLGCAQIQMTVEGEHKKPVLLTAR